MNIKIVSIAPETEAFPMCVREVLSRHLDKIIDHYVLASNIGASLQRSFGSNWFGGCLFDCYLSNNDTVILRLSASRPNGDQKWNIAKFQWVN